MRSRRPASTHAGRREALSAETLGRCSEAGAASISTAAVLMAPFVVIYGVLFVYPTIKMVAAQPSPTRR